MARLDRKNLMSHGRGPVAQLLYPHHLLEIRPDRWLLVYYGRSPARSVSSGSRESAPSRTVLASGSDGREATSSA